MVIIPIRPFLLDVSLHAPRQPAHARRDPEGKPSGTRAYCPSLKFSQSTLDDLGHNRGGTLPMNQATCRQLVPTQGCQDLSHTKCKIRAMAATCSTSVTIVPRCTWAPTERHSSPVEAVLTGSEVTLLGLVEIPRSPRGKQHY